MKHRQLQAFRNVMESGTISQAAKLMFITQPAVSRLISELEIYLGFKLFERKKGRLVATPEARTFYKGVDRFFIGIEELENSAQKIRDEGSGALKICATPALSTGILPRAIAAFQRTNSKVDIEIETASFSRIALRLQTFQTDIGISHGFPDLPGIEQFPMTHIAHVCAMHKNHPLAQKDIIHPEDLINQNVLRIMPEGSVNWNGIQDVLGDANIRFRSNYGTQSSHTGYAIIAENLAIGIIEPFAAKPWLREHVVVRRFEPEILYPYVVALPEGHPMPSKLREFIDVLRTEMESFSLDT
jgi:DNA-binding transcriptional LysR family regulator